MNSLLLMIALMMTSQSIPNHNFNVESVVLSCSPMECEKYWSRAVFYISQNSNFSFKNVNKVLIETEKKPTGSSSVSYLIERGGGELKITLSCSNAIECQPRLSSEINNIKNAILLNDKSCF
ncbi:hypothetical protein IHE26_16950 (plasmid) [Plesiomonas shigelloides]|uniref:hypothetical protein n=1 Tax=Plesiomonas shigelloides TaxID=703 RepID=UPI00177AFF3E|nr:hypothetical protein [Plesiomonas shigelloides]QOH81561.1 hypothetical protein IHE26_16950 [Plesiomonas shigelloides]